MKQQQKRLRKLCQKWQKQLRLQDWDVTVIVVRQFDTRHDINGLCSFNISLKSAVIRIVATVDHDPGLHRKANQEQILVHELLHLHFAPFMKNEDSETTDPQHTDKEIAIDLIARALVPKAKRK